MARGWISLVGLAVFLAVVAACSGPAGDGSASSSSASAEAGRWKLPASVATAGARVRVTYDEAPRWTTAAACGGRLLAGGQKLGAYLRAKNAAVTSVGGYSCRRNTADTTRMSVHGTGRALDVFIAKTGGAADNGQGDKVANWLVTNAQRIGVQLVIWDRTIWRANGTNDGAYGGPHPHDDHLHVELSAEAGLARTPWFDDMDDVTTADGGADDDNGDDGDDDASTATDGGRTSDARADAAKDAGTDAKKDAAPPVEPEEDEPVDAGTPPPSTASPGEMEPPGDSRLDPSDGVESAGDAPGETDSLADSPKSKKTSSADDEEPIPTGGCSAAPRGQGRGNDPTGALGGLAVAMGLAAWLRRKRDA